MSDTKVCTKCKEEKLRSEFSKNRKTKDGLNHQCRACRKQQAKNYYQENRERDLERNKQWRQENYEQRLRYLARWRQENSNYFTQYYKENWERKRDYSRQWNQNNREARSNYFKQHYKENKERYVEKCAKYRALKQDGIPETLRDCPIEKERLVQIYKLRDLLTKSTGVQYHVDHIWPLSKGGPHWSGNLQIITAEENLSKGDSFCEDTARVIQESLNENTCS